MNNPFDLSPAQERGLLGKYHDNAKTKKTSTPKYKNTKVKLDGMTFDSQKEANRYLFLKSEMQAGRITELAHHVSFELMPKVKFANEKRAKPALRYIADFVYTNAKTGLQVVEDVKSAMTRKLAAYRQKKHLMMSVHNIEIQEV